eukprot:jgi/Chlat1/4648/Chrsp3S05599
MASFSLCMLLCMSLSALLASSSLTAAHDTCGNYSVPAHRRQVTIDYPRLYPESVEWDRCRGRWIVGSVRTPAIYQVNPRTGAVKVWARFPDHLVKAGATGSFGIQLDTYYNRLIVTTANTTGPSLEFVLKVGVYTGLAAFDLKTRRFLWSVDLRTTLSEDQKVGLHAVNDVVVAPDGASYVTDTVGGLIWRVGKDGNDAEVFVVDQETLGGLPIFGANGIEYYDGSIIVGNAAKSSAVKIRLSDKQVTPISITPPLEGPDGIRFVDGQLVAVQSQNQLVVVLESADGWDTARRVASYELVGFEPGQATASAVNSKGQLWVVEAFVGDNALPEQTRQVFGLTRVGF